MNRKRIKKLRAKQFGPKREWIVTLPCVVTGRMPVDPAHVLGTRGAGAGSEGLCPLTREVHQDFDEASESAFKRKWGRTKAWVRARAQELEVEWQSRQRSA